MPEWIVNEACLGTREFGERLDRWLAEQTEASRSQVRRWLERGAVAVDGRVERKGGRRLVVGERVSLDRPVSSWVGSGEELEVLSRGPDWVAVNKPAGVAVHPLEPDESGTLLGRVADRFPEVVGIGEEGELRSGVVHRLDVDTSGVVLFALSEARWSDLRRAFSGHRVEKTYRAIVAGRPADAGSETLPLAVVRHRPARVAVVDPGHLDARACSLDWRLVRAGPRSSLVEIDLHTGFLHQARVMFSAIGHPLLGDPAYGDASIAERAPRQMLHALSVRCGEIHGACEPPRDFIETLEREGLV